MERDFDRRKKRGAGPPSDVWSAGCLLYEILTGKFLFYDDDDDDLGRFMIRLTGVDEELIPDFRRANVDDNKEAGLSLAAAYRWCVLISVCPRCRFSICCTTCLCAIRSCGRRSTMSSNVSVRPWRRCCRNGLAAHA
jgi:serine/threonine protein kinase